MNDGDGGVIIYSMVRGVVLLMWYWSRDLKEEGGYSKVEICR